ncbi:MAG TPA: cobalamin-binding protein [Candidatus Tumulicola sp.]|nr:cobalamin-binding protein [Candidatus Tumulicola sp.]
MSLLPSATEILYAIGAGDQVVGVTHECDFPIETRGKPHLTSSSLPQVARSADIDRHVRAHLHVGSSIYALDGALLERLEPDLIVTQELCPVCAVSYEIVSAATKRLKGDPRIVSLEPSSLEDVYDNILAVGELVSHSERAKKFVDGLRLRERNLRALVAGRSTPRALVLEWTDPPMSGGHWTPEIVELAGGVPVLGNPRKDSQRLEWSAIALADPDFIIVAPCGFDLTTTERETRALEGNQIWRELRAVNSGALALVDGNAYLNRPGPRLLDTAEIFAVALHPEVADQLPRYPDGWKIADRKM